MSETMSLTRVLSEIKMLKKRITKAIQEGTFIGMSKGIADSRKVYGMRTQETVSDFETRIKANGQQVKDLINRFESLRVALIRTNSATVITDSSVVVKLGGETMTIAEAIDKKLIMEYKKSYLHVIRQQYSTVSSSIESANYTLNQEIEKALTIAYANDKSKVSAEQYSAIAEPRKKEHEAAAIDPLGLLNMISSFEEEIELFTTELDFTLSEINARTQVQI
jgi:hypothetical protein